jgi:DNA-binding transcriptional LysR family regulator
MEWHERIGRRLRLQDLHTFQTVVRMGSMAKAARHLGLSQPAISKAIAGIEGALGVPLLDRNPRGIELTACGQALLNRGAVIFDELRQGVQDIEYLSKSTDGEVRIGSTEAVGGGIVTSIINKMSRQYPRIVFRIVQADTDTLHRQLLERSIDVVIVRLINPIVDDNLAAEILCDDSLVVVAGAHNKLIRRQSLTLRDLVEEPWALQAYDTLLGATVVEAFQAAGLSPPRATVFTTSMSMRVSLLVSGRFLSAFMGSMFCFPTKHPRLRALAVDLSTTRRPLAIVTVKGRTLSPVVQRFIEYARITVRPLASSTGLITGRRGTGSSRTSRSRSVDRPL